MNCEQGAALFGFAVATIWWFFVAAVATKIEDWQEKRREQELEREDG